MFSLSLSLSPASEYEGTISVTYNLPTDSQQKLLEN